MRYIQVIDLNTLFSDTKCFLVRRVEKSFDEVFNSLGIVREDAILQSQIPNMSMNLLGSFFLKEHLKFKQHGIGADTWQGKPVYFMDMRKHFEVLPNQVAIYFKANELNDVTFPYHRSDDKETRKIVRSLNLRPKTNEEGKIIFHGNAAVLHTPTNLNYWHVEWKLMDQEGKTITNIKGRWKESAALAMAQILTGCGSPEDPQLIPISKNYYRRSAKKLSLPHE